jgi:phospholipase/carboxylesterase
VSPALARRQPGVSRRDFLKAGLSVLATPVVSSCLGSVEPNGAPFVTARLTARPGIPTATPTPGLSQLGLGQGRDGLLYVPQTYSADTPFPLFVALHGAGGSSGDWQHYFERAEARGMVLLAPDSRDVTWNAAGATFGADVAFVDRALTYTFESCRIDPARIALAGFSDGAACALSLGLTNGDLFTHLVAYSPGRVVLRSAPVGTPLIFISHGAQDSVIAASISEDQTVPYLRAAGYNVVYQAFQGGHEVPAAIAEASLDWFFSDVPPIPSQSRRMDTSASGRSRD